MPLTTYRRGAIWHYRGTVAGRRLRGSCKTTDKTIAQRIASDKEGREWRRHLDGPEAVLTFANAVMLYRKAGRPTRYLPKLEDRWKNTLVKHITAGAIRQSSIDLLPGTTNSTKNRHVIVPTPAAGVGGASTKVLLVVSRGKRSTIIVLSAFCSMPP